MEKFCYRCGALEKEKGPLIDGLCRDCFLEENPLLKVPEELELEICNQCGAYFIDNDFFDIKANPAREYLEGAKKLVLSELEVLQMGPTGVRYVDFEDSENVDVGLRADYTESDNIVVEVEVQTKITESQEEPYTEKAKTIVETAQTRCEVCRKIDTGYYEAVLQVRGQEEIPEERLSQIYQDIQEEFSKIHDRNREEFVSKIKRKHGGIDLYASSSQLAHELGRFLKNEYGAEIDESAELIGQTSEGEDNYRVTVVARLPF